jgi:DNA-binding CsgD family transcriptional regulator/tetratricopeptide (TPR) repeat protein
MRRPEGSARLCQSATPGTALAGGLRLDSAAAIGEALRVGGALRVSSAEGLVGREAELAVVAAAVRQLSEGQASALVIEGEAGIGKTRLVQGVVDDARSRDVTVFCGQAHPFEHTRPFGVLTAALDLSRRSPDPRRAAIGELLAGPGAGAPARAAGGIQYLVVEEIVDLVEASCAERPVLLVAEDIHWADSASLLAILSVARQLPLAALLVVVTARPSPLSAEVVRLLDDLAAGGARTLQLRPLKPGDVAVLARHVLGASPGPALTAMLAKAGGNPLWAVAMLRSLADEGMLHRAGDSVEAATSELPASLSDLVVRRLRHLPAATLELLQVTSVLGDAVSLRDVAAVARRPPAEVVRQLSDAFDAQLLDEADDRVVFRHQLVHDAIYQHLPPPARRLLHREAAVALMAAGADRLDVADHLMLGAERGDEQAVAWLRDAAREASAQAPLVTVELLRRAEALLPGGHRDADLVSAEVVQALLRAGKVAEASARAEAVLARQHAAEVDTPLRLALVGALALQNRAAELIAVAQASLADSARLQPAEQVLMLAQQSWALVYTGDPRAGESAAGQALVIAEQAGDGAMAVWALTALLVAVGRQGRYGEALACARRAAALATGSPDTRSLPLQPKFFLGLALFDCDLVGEARAAYREALAEEFGSGLWLPETLMADAQAAFAVGEWADAVPGLIAGGQAAQEKGNQLLVAQSLAYRAIIAAATGDHRAAGELAAGIAGSLEGGQLSYNAGILAFAAAGVKAAGGDRPGAYDLLLRCWRFDAARQCRFYHRALAPDLVRLALALGHRDVAAEVASTVAAGVARAPEVPTVRSLALRCQGLAGGDAGPLIEAVALARRAPLLIEHAGACEDAAGLLAHGGRREEAAALLAEALDRYEQAGADAWAGRVRAQLRALGVHPAPRGPRRRPAGGWNSLTATERAVSLLVAEGLTNGAVARRLYISPHTVNTHLRHVFAKLGVPNRVALAAVVHHSIK